MKPAKGFSVKTTLMNLSKKANLWCTYQKSSGILKRICNNIPQTHYKSLYYALFESHLSYCITVFGNVCKTHSEKLFTIQKHCM